MRLSFHFIGLTNFFFTNPNSFLCALLSCTSGISLGLEPLEQFGIGLLLDVTGSGGIVDHKEC